MQKKRSILKEIGIVIMISALLGILVNLVNPSGIPMFLDESRYSEETSGQRMEEFLNNPTDTTSKSLPLHTKRNPEKTKEGYIKPQNIKLDFAKILFDRNALFIDGRTSEEFNTGHIKNAINLPYTEFANKPEEERIDIMKKYNKDGIIVCYCDGGSCDISVDLAYAIAKLGFNSVNIYLGGFKEWKDSGYPTNKD